MGWEIGLGGEKSQENNKEKKTPVLHPQNRKWPNFHTWGRLYLELESHTPSVDRNTREGNRSEGESSRKGDAPEPVDGAGTNEPELKFRDRPIGGT